MWQWPWSKPSPAPEPPRQPPPVPEATPADAACSFCGRPRAEVRLLVAVPKAAICEACVTYVLAAMDWPEHGEPAPGTPVLRAAARELLAAMPPDTPHAISSPVLDAAAALATSVGERHELSLEAFRLRNSPAALRLLDVPDATPTMVLNASTCLLSAGEPEGALARLRALDTAGLAPVDQAQHRLNLAAALLGLSPAPLVEAEAVLAEAEALLSAAGDDPHVAAWAVCVENSRGDIALARGEPEAAETRYRAALANGATGDAATWRRLGDALAAQGRASDARQARETALSLAHPDSRIAAGLRGDHG